MLQAGSRRAACGRKLFFPGRKSGQVPVKTVCSGKQPRLRLVLLLLLSETSGVGETTSSDGRLEKRGGGGGACEEA